MKTANEVTDTQAPHYQTADKQGQHWDRAWEKYREAWFVLNITKYVERHAKKNGLSDLRKAQHYMQKLIELEGKEYVDHMGTSPPDINGACPVVRAITRGLNNADCALLANFICHIIERYRKSGQTDWNKIYLCHHALNNLVNLYGDERERITVPT